MSLVLGMAKGDRQPPPGLASPGRSGPQRIPGVGCSLHSSLGNAAPCCSPKNKDYLQLYAISNFKLLVVVKECVYSTSNLS